MSNWKERARNRADVLKSFTMLLVLFWMPAWMSLTMEGTTLKEEYQEYGQVFRCLCIMLWTGEFMDSHTLYGDYR